MAEEKQQHQANQMSMKPTRKTSPEIRKAAAFIEKAVAFKQTRAYQTRGVAGAMAPDGSSTTKSSVRSSEAIVGNVEATP